MIRKMKKGFTIVELVIVIAVIAVLTAILVPTFISISNKADKASDQSLKNYLNKALAIVENDIELNKNGDNATLHYAVEDLDNYGISLDKIVTKSDEKLVWNQADNRFYFESQAPAAVADRLNYWKIQTNDNDDEGYSIYAGRGFAAENGVVNVKVGFDAGYQENVKQINYTNTGSQKTVAIRSNGGSLIVNAPLDTVHHYSDLDSLSVERIAGKSYHEHGNVKVSATLNDGHVVVESTGFINELDIPENATSTASVDIKTNAVVNSAVIDSDSATVEIAAGAEVNQLVGETTNVTGEGSAEAKTNAITKTIVSDNESLKLAISQEKEYIVLSDDITVTNEAVDFEYNFVLDGANHTLTPAAGLVRGINVGASGYIKNISVDCKNMYTIDGTNYPRGINVYGDNANLVIDNVKVFNITHYAINVPMIESPTLTITNSELTGYAALNLWASNYTVTVSNSTLKGINNSSGSSSDFSTICLEGDTTDKTTLHSSSVDVKVLNSTLYAIANKTCRQKIIGFNSHSVSNTVSLIGCAIVLDDSGLTALYRDDGEGNRLFINNEQVNVPKIKNCWYSNGDFTADRSAPNGMSTRFEVPFEQGWLCDGEGIILDMDVKLEGNLKYQVAGTIYLFLNNHTISGGKIELSSGVRVIMDNGNCSSLFFGGSISVTNNQDGTYTYLCA